MQDTTHICSSVSLKHITEVTVHHVLSYFSSLSYSLSPSLSAPTTSFCLYACLANMMDGPITPPAVNEADKDCDVDFTATQLSKTF